MTLRPADLRFLAPTLPRRVRLLGTPEGLEDAFRDAGAELVDGGPDMVVAAAGQAAVAASSGAPFVVVLGRRTRSLRRAGYATRTLLVRHGRSGPRLFVPLDASAALEHALYRPRPGRSTIKRAAARGAVAAARAGIPVVSTVTVAARTPELLPAFLRGAAETGGLLLGKDWSLDLGDGDDLQRALWLCFEGNAGPPAWAVKFTRAPGNGTPFERDEAAAEVVGQLPAEVRGHVPQYVGRFRIDGLHALVESAASGTTLQEALEHGGAGPRTVDAIADWIIALGEATLAAPPALSPELRRLERDVLPKWKPERRPESLGRGLDGVPAVLQHNDLGTWNIVVGTGTFTVLDWESTRPAGLPLCDLVYFLTDALSPRLADPDSRTEAMLALLRGNAGASPRLFERVAAAADSLRIRRDVVGAIVTLGWLQHGLSHIERAERASGEAARAAVGSPPAAMGRIAAPWLRDPALGVDWPGFARWANRSR
jgi:hypothetical protein